MTEEVSWLRPGLMEKHECKQLLWATLWIVRSVAVIAPFQSREFEKLTRCAECGHRGDRDDHDTQFRTGILLYPESAGAIANMLILPIRAILREDASSSLSTCWANDAAQVRPKLFVPCFRNWENSASKLPEGYM